MEDESVLREAIARRDSALAEARRLDEFVRLYNELRGGGRPPLSVVSDAGKAGSPISDEFVLDKTRSR